MSPKNAIHPLALHRVVWLGLLCIMAPAMAEAYSIPPEQLDRKLVYYGAPSAFEKPAEVNYERVVRATPEYQEIQSQNIERGTGRYWILLSRASDRVGRLVANVGSTEDYDLIAAQGYLTSLDPVIPAEDITETVLDALESSTK